MVLALKSMEALMSVYEKIEDSSHVMFRKTWIDRLERMELNEDGKVECIVTEVEDHHDVPAQFVTVYEVTRHYGGPQEGGWWWDCRNPVASIPTDGTKVDVEKVIEFLKPRFADEGNIGSVNGGVEYHIEAEVEAGSSANLSPGEWS